MKRTSASHVLVIKVAYFSVFTLVFLICMCVSIYVSNYVHRSELPMEVKAFISSGAGDRGGCEPPRVGHRNSTLVLYKRISCS